MENGAVLVLVVLLGAAVVSGSIGMLVGRAKNRDTASSFWLGALLGVVGILIVALLPNGLPSAPAGMRTVKCQRCNAAQNIPERGTTFECWQCRQSSKVAKLAPKTDSEDMRDWLDRTKRNNFGI